MKKIFTLIAMTMMAYAVQAAITIHVKADAAPYLYAWGTGVTGFNWPGKQLSETKQVQGETFYYYTFDEAVTKVNIIFNNGSGKQTGNIEGITESRYFTYDGAQGYEDVSESYGVEIPDAEVDKLSIHYNDNDAWADLLFTEVEKNKTYVLVLDVNEVAHPEDVFEFVLLAGDGGWLNYQKLKDVLTAPACVVEGVNPDNFEIDLTATTATVFTFTANWTQGKVLTEGWTLKIEEGNTSGIAATTFAAEKGAQYTLTGQRAASNYRGIVVRDGKKFFVK